MTEEAKKKRDELAEQHQWEIDKEFGAAFLNLEEDSFKKGFDAGYQMAMDEANERIQKLRKALEFYADRDNWSDYPASSSPDSYIIYAMDYTFADIARASLKEDDSKST